jgi:hypothetical protein
MIIKSRSMRWAEHVRRMGTGGEVVMGKPERKTTGTLRLKWENNIKWILEKCDGSYGLD